MLQIPDINTKDARDTGKAVSRKELRPGVRVSGPANPKRVTHAIHIDSIEKTTHIEDVHIPHCKLRRSSIM